MRIGKDGSGEMKTRYHGSRLHSPPVTFWRRQLSLFGSRLHGVPGASCHRPRAPCCGTSHRRGTSQHRPPDRQWRYGGVAGWRVAGLLNGLAFLSHSSLPLNRCEDTGVGVRCEDTSVDIQVLGPQTAFAGGKAHKSLLWVTGLSYWSKTCQGFCAVVMRALSFGSERVAYAILHRDGSGQSR